MYRRRFESIFLRHNNTEEIAMSESMCIDSENEGPIPEDPIVIKEYVSPAETVVTFDGESFVDLLESHGSEYSLIVTLRREHH